jgi:hypothetical protein
LNISSELDSHQHQPSHITDAFVISYWDYIERLKLFVDSGFVDFTFVDEFSTMVVKSLEDADLRRSTFKALLHILFSELNPIPPSSAGFDEVTIPPYDFEAYNPSSSPVYSQGNTFDLKNTQPPTEEAVSPAPVLSQPEHTQVSNKPVGTELSLPANTRVDLKNSAAVAFYSGATFCFVLLSAVLLFIHES